MFFESINQILFLIFIFVFGAWSGVTFAVWQMSKSKYKTINEYMEYNFPNLYQRWYKNDRKEIE